MGVNEKLDLILKELYESREDIGYYSLDRVIKNARISISAFGGPNALAEELKRNRLITLKGGGSGVAASITPEGILFCENTSYAYPGYPIIHIFPDDMTVNDR